MWGPSGSGKTTLLHALGGLVEPTAGEVLWKGAPLSSLDASARGRARARGIAYVFQGSNLLPAFTAYENVAFAACAAGERDRRRTARDRAPRHWSGSTRRRESLPSELSGGEAQRVAIARALAQRARAAALRRADRASGHRHDGPRARDGRRAAGRLGFALVVATHDADVAAGLGRRDRAA